MRRSAAIILPTVVPAARSHMEVGAGSPRRRREDGSLRPRALLDELPTELLCNALRFLHVADTSQVAQTCQRMRALLDSPVQRKRAQLHGIRLTEPERAIARLRELARAENGDACLVLGLLEVYHLCDYEAGMLTLEKAAGTGHAGATYNLALITRNLCVRGVKDASEAARHVSDWLPARLEVGLESRCGIAQTGSVMHPMLDWAEAARDRGLLYETLGVSWGALEEMALAAVREWGIAEPAHVMRKCAAHCGRWYPRRRVRPAHVSVFTVCSRCYECWRQFVPYCGLLCQKLHWYSSHRDLCAETHVAAGPPGAPAGAPPLPAQTGAFGQMPGPGAGASGGGLVG